MVGADWRDFFRSRGVEEQLVPSLNQLNISFGYYRVHLDEVTDVLVDSGFVVYPHLEDIVQTKDQWRHVISEFKTLEKHQHLILPHTLLIPPNDVNERSKDPEQYSDHLLRKYWYVLPVRIDKSYTPAGVKLIQNMANIELGQYFVGYDIGGSDLSYTDQFFRVSQIVDAVRGYKLYNMNKSFNLVPDENISVYTPQEMKQRGASTIIHKIPSVRTYQEGPYDVNLQHIAIFNSAWSLELKPHVAKTSYELKSEHACERVTSEVTYRRRTKTGKRQGTQISFCHHVVFAYLLAENKLRREGIDIILNPFFRPQTEDFKYYDRMRMQVLKEYVGEDSTVKRAPLNLTEMEIMFWNLKAKDAP